MASEISTIKEALEDIKAGKMIVVVDDETRENEGDIIMAAEKVNAEAVKGADYETATRKIWRMRGPVAEAILKKRASFDPEYLGLAAP